MKIASIRLNFLRIIFELTVNLLKPPKVYLRNVTSISEIHFYDDLSEIIVSKKIVLRKQVSNELHVINIFKKDQIVLVFVITVVNANFEMSKYCEFLHLNI